MVAVAADNPGLRLSVVGIVALSLFAALFVRMYTLQVLQRSDFQQVATDNRLRVVHQQAPRGRILDRNQNVLVDSKEVLQVVADVRELPTAEAEPEERARVLGLLATQLSTEDTPVTVAALEEELADNLIDPFAPVPIVTDVSDDVMVSVMERQSELPGISVRRTTVRQYPYGSLGAHVLGYVGSITQEKLDQIEEETDGRNPDGYEPGDEIGRTGVEAAYEEVLRGEPGQTTYEVDSAGNVVRVVPEATTMPVPGHDVLTTLDVNIQYLAETELATRMGVVEDTYPDAGGSIVVMAPETGGVVAMASYPTFNPNDFLNGISQSQYAELADPNGPLPLLNRAVAGEYAPGSTFKPFTALAALDNGVRTPVDAVNDTGEYRVQNCEGDTCIFANSESQPHGVVDMRRSLEVSSNYYYYEIGDLLWLRRDEVGEEALQETARSFGFGEPTGIELGEERGGVVPTPERMAQNFEENPDVFARGDWLSGDNVNLAIGQGDLLATPLQVANAYAALANGGNLWRPHLATAMGDPVDTGIRPLERYEPQLLGRYNLTPATRQPIVDGLLGVTQGAEGTAVAAFDDYPVAWPIAGKTGTSQKQGEQNTSLFAAFGPVVPDQPPQYVAAAILEQAGYGGDVAAPLIARIFAGIADPAQLPMAPRAEDVLNGTVPTTVAPTG